MSKPVQSHLKPALRYGAATLLTLMALLITQLLWPWLTPAAAPLFLGVVVVAAFSWGLGPALLATALSVVAIDYYFVPPLRQLEFTVPSFVRAGTFLCVAVLASSLSVARKKLLNEVQERAREREELLAQIRGFNDELRNQVESATLELSAANDSLFQMQQRVSRLERLSAIGQMAASLAHEIGTPLNAISGHLELLSTNHPHHADTQRRIKIITRQLDSIVGIVKGLLEWTHRRRTFPQPIEVNELVEELLRLVGPTLDKHSISVQAKLDQNLPVLEADRDAVLQVFLNLINNSIDAMPDGGRIEISTRLNARTEQAEIVFHDTGPGIEAGALDHLFEPMWTTKQSGGGFGLAVAHEIMSDHGGRIEVIQEQREGAAFRLTLPLVQPAMNTAIEEGKRDVA